MPDCVPYKIQGIRPFLYFKISSNLALKTTLILHLGKLDGLPKETDGQ